MKIKETTKLPFLIKLWMNFFGYDGLATPWNTIYYKNITMIKNEKLRRHEKTHIEQMERDGKLLYLIKYNWYWLIMGYEKNPYEIEAREAELNHEL